MQEPLLPSSAPSTAAMRPKALSLFSKAKAIFWLPTLVDVKQWMTNSTEQSFIRSEVNGRQSRRIVLLAFYITEVIGGLEWAVWCGQNPHQSQVALLEDCKQADTHTCMIFGIYRFVVLVVGLPVEGVTLFLAGWKPWSFWSDFLLLSVWFTRFLFSNMFGRASPSDIVGDVIWFFVLAVMCRVHSLVLVILALTLNFSALMRMHEFASASRYEHFAALIIAGAYFLDEVSRLRSFNRLMSLEGDNSKLAENLLWWKMLTSGADIDSNNEEQAKRATSAESSSSTYYSRSPRLFKAGLPPSTAPDAYSTRSSDRSRPGVRVSYSKLHKSTLLPTVKPHQTHLVPTIKPQMNSGQYVPSSSRYEAKAIFSDRNDSLSICDVLE